MATHKRGLDILLSIGTTAIGGQRNASIEMSAESIDVSTKTTGDWKAKMTGAKEWSCECDGLYVDGDTGYQSALDAFMNGTTIDVKMADEKATVGFTGKAVITSFSFDAPYEDCMTYTMSFEGVGGLEPINL
jgi:TP901-1 family phage major tail protein